MFINDILSPSVHVLAYLRLIEVNLFLEQSQHYSLRFYADAPLDFGFGYAALSCQVPISTLSLLGIVDETGH